MYLRAYKKGSIHNSHLTVRAILAFKKLDFLYFRRICTLTLSLNTFSLKGQRGEVDYLYYVWLSRGFILGRDAFSKVSLLRIRIPFRFELFERAYRIHKSM